MKLQSRMSCVETSRLGGCATPPSTAEVDEYVNPNSRDQANTVVPYLEHDGLGSHICRFVASAMWLLGWGTNEVQKRLPDSVEPFHNGYCDI